MNTETDISEASTTPVLQRRKFLAFAAAGSAVLPAVALAGAGDKTSRLPQAAELPIDRFDCHAVEISDVLNEYLDGKFYACIYPSQDYEHPIFLKSIAAERRPLAERFETAVNALKAVLAEMHPEVDQLRHRYVPLNEGRSYAFWIDGSSPSVRAWDGPGTYEVGSSKHVPAGEYRIERFWSDEDRRHYLYGAYVFHGEHVAPREIIDPRQIVRKVEGAPA